MSALSLKSRFAIVMSIGALALVGGVGAITVYFAKKDLLAAVSTQQRAIAIREAERLDANLADALESLAASTATMPVEASHDEKDFFAYFSQRDLPLRLFDNIVIVDAQGIARAAYPDNQQLAGIDVSDRIYFRQVTSTGKPVISKPLRGKLSGTPFVSIAVPIFDTDKTVRGVAVGVLSLAKRNLLGGMSAARVGKDGYFIVVTTGPEPVYLVHPDSKRLMQPVSLDKTSAVAHIFNTGSSGSVVGTLDDDRVLISYQSLSTNDWLLAAVFPESEAFAQIDGERATMIRTTVGIAAAVLLLVWLLVARLLRPLTVLRRQIETIATDPENATLVTVGHDEVGEVALAFNQMLEGQRTSEALRLAGNRDLGRLVAILENSRDFVAMTNTAGQVTYINASGRAVRGLRPDDEIGGTTLRDHFPAWACDKIQNEGVPAALADGIWVGETAVIGKDGADVPIDHTLIAHRDGEGRLDFFSSLMHDTSIAKATAAAIRASEAGMRLLADALPVHVAFLDSDFRYRFVNSGYETHFGVDKSQVLGKSVAELIGPEAYAAYLPHLEQASRGQTQVFERDSLAGVRPVQFLVKLIPRIDEQRQVIGYYLIHQDVTDQKLEHLRLSKLVRADALTGLLNRVGFEAAIDEAMQRSRVDLAMALFYLDIDRFKSINDQHGHPAGDKLLRAFAGRLVYAVRAADVTARLGGDEFVVIAEGLRTAATDVRSIAAKILHAMQPEFDLDGVKLAITVSIGIASCAGQAMQSDELISRADAALYRAKNAGRNRYDIDDPTQSTTFASLSSGEARERTPIS